MHRAVGVGVAGLAVGLLLGFAAGAYVGVDTSGAGSAESSASDAGMPGAVPESVDVRAEPPRAAPVASDGDASSAGTERKARRAGAGKPRRDADRLHVDVNAVAPTPETIRVRVEEMFREQTGAELPGEQADHVTGEILQLHKHRRAVFERSVESDVRAKVAHLVARHKLIAAVGILADSVDILLQASGRQRGTHPASVPSDATGHEPIDVAAPVKSYRGRRAFVRGGVIPFDKALLVERIETYSRFTARGGSAKFVVTGRTVRELYRKTGAYRDAFEGLQVVPPTMDESVHIDVSDGAAEMRVVGRLVPLAEVDGIEQRPLTWVAEGSDPRFEGGTIRMQVLADHGGGNDRTLRLDGSTNGRFHEISENEIWDHQLDLRRNRRSLAWISEPTRLPPGKHLRITRIDYRARLDPEGSSHSDLVIEVDGKKLVHFTADEEKAPNGMWTGDVVIDGERLSAFEFTLSYFGMGEITVYAQVVDPPGR